MISCSVAARRPAAARLGWSDGLAEQGDAEAEQDDARVLDAREAEEALDVVLRRSRRGSRPVR